MGVCFLGIQQGWFSGVGTSKGLMQALTPMSEKKDDSEKEKTTMQDATEKERRMRDRCANGLHLSAAILACRDIQ